MSRGQRVAGVRAIKPSPRDRSIYVLPGAILAVVLTPMNTRGELGASLDVVLCTGVLRAFDPAVSWDGIPGRVRCCHRCSPVRWSLVSLNVPLMLGAIKGAVGQRLRAGLRNRITK